MTRWRLTIEFDGGPFMGWQRQDHGPSVQEALEQALFRMTGELATLNLRHQIPVFLIVSQRGSIDDHRIYQEVQGRRTLPLLQTYDFPYHIVDRPDDVSVIPDAFETCRMQKRPFVLFLTRRLVKGEGAA